MKILHGEDTTASRGALFEMRKTVKSAGGEVVVLAGKALELEGLIQAVEGSLFGGQRLVVIEGLLSGLVSSRQKQLISYLQQQQPKTVVLWEGKKLTPAVLNKFEAEAVEFKINPAIFAFVESIRPGNIKTSLGLLEKAIEQAAAELVFFMIVRQFRLLIQALDGQFKGPSWLAGKLKQQAEAWGRERLISMHEQLYEIDKKMKTGRSGLSLTEELELWLINL